MRFVKDSFDDSLVAYFPMLFNEYPDEVDLKRSVGKMGAGQTMLMLKFDGTEGGVVVFDDIIASRGYGADGRPRTASQRSRGWFVPDDDTFDRLVDEVASGERVDAGTLTPLDLERGRMYDFGYREPGLDGAPDMGSFEAFDAEIEDDVDEFRSSALGSTLSFFEQGLHAAHVLEEKRLGLKSDISPNLHVGYWAIGVASPETTTMLLHFESTDGGLLVRQRDVSVDPIGSIPCVDSCVIPREADFNRARDMFCRRGIGVLPGFVSHVVENLDLYDDISGAVDTIGHMSRVPTKGLGPAMRLVSTDEMPRGVPLSQRSELGVEECVSYALWSGDRLAQEHRRLASISPKALDGLSAGFDSSESLRVDGDHDVRMLKFDGMEGGLVMFDYVTTEQVGRDDFDTHEHMGMNLLITDEAFYGVRDALVDHAEERDISLKPGRSIDLGQGGHVFCDLARRLMGKNSTTVELDEVTDSRVRFDQYCEDSYEVGLASGRRAGRLREGISVAYSQLERMRESAGAQRGAKSPSQASVERQLTPEADVTPSV